MEEVIVFERKELLDGVKKAIKGSYSHGTLRVLAMMKVERVYDQSMRFTCTNLEATISMVRYALEASKEIQPFLVDARAFFLALKATNGERITLKPHSSVNLIEIKDDRCTIDFKNVSWNISEFPDTEFGNAHQIGGQDLVNIAVRVSFAASVDDARPVLQGVLYDGENVAVTDGFRITCSNAPAPLQKPREDMSMIMPAKHLQAAYKMIKSPLLYRNFEKGIVFLEGEMNSRYSFQLIDGKFPNYKAIIPSKRTLTVVVNRDELSKALKVASQISTKFGSGACKLEVKESELTIRTESEDFGNTSSCISAEVREKRKKITEGFSFLVAFNPAMMLQYLKTVWCEKVRLSFYTNNAPIHVQPIGEDSIEYVQMPMHIG